MFQTAAVPQLNVWVGRGRVVAGRNMCTGDEEGMNSEEGGEDRPAVISYTAERIIRRNE